jgi:superfamily I DNA/RNA helicase
VAINQWETIKLTKTRNEVSTHDQAACLRIFAAQGTTLADALTYAEHILAAKGPVTLTTIHQAKGLEFDHVILLDRRLIRTSTPDKPNVQEDNLLYVGITRAKRILWYADTENWT